MLLVHSENIFYLARSLLGFCSRSFFCWWWQVHLTSFWTVKYFFSKLFPLSPSGYEDPDHFVFQNIEEGKTYNLVMYIRSPDSVELTASLTCSRPSGALQNLSSASIQYVSFPWHGGNFELFFYLLTDILLYWALQGYCCVQLDKVRTATTGSRNMHNCKTWTNNFQKRSIVAWPSVTHAFRYIQGVLHFYPFLAIYKQKSIIA